MFCEYTESEESVTTLPAVTCSFPTHFLTCCYQLCLANSFPVHFHHFPCTKTLLDTLEQCCNIADDPKCSAMPLNLFQAFWVKMPVSLLDSRYEVYKTRSHLQWPLTGCTRGCRVCSGSTPWGWRVCPLHTAAHEGTCHHTTAQYYTITDR